MEIDFHKIIDIEPKKSFLKKDINEAKISKNSKKN